MSINDFYYDAVIKQQAVELREAAAQGHLAKIAREARKQERARRREVRRLQIAVNGPRSLRQTVRELFVPQRPATTPKATRRQDQDTTRHPAGTR